MIKLGIEPRIQKAKQGGGKEFSSGKRIQEKREKKRKKRGKKREKERGDKKGKEKRKKKGKRGKEN